MKKGNIIVRTKVKTGTQDPGIDPEVTTDNPRTRTRTQTGTGTGTNGNKIIPFKSDRKSSPIYWPSY